MDSISKKTNFFLDAYTPRGLCSFYAGFYSADKAHTAYLITGGIASVCSMLIKLVSDNITSQGFSAEQISNPLCSHQLDAVCFPELNVYVSNGGERRAFSEKYPLAHENVVSLLPCFDGDIIKKNSQDIMQMFREEGREKLRATGFLSAALSLMNDSRMIERRYMDSDKILRYASRLARRELGKRRSKNGREYKRFLSSITPNGVETYTETLLTMCRRFYVFSDRYGAVTEYLMELIKEYAISGGYDVIACYCPMSGGLSAEHLIIPESELCFFSDKAYHSAEFAENRKISSNRFVDIKAMTESKKRLSFDRKAANEMLGEAVKLFSSAESIRKRLDFIYFSCLDKSALCSAADKITSEILSNNKR